jgi:hypothetical protein
MSQQSSTTISDLERRLREKRAALSRGYESGATHAWLKQIGWEIRLLENALRDSQRKTP